MWNILKWFKSSILGRASEDFSSFPNHEKNGDILCTSDYTINFEPGGNNTVVREEESMII
jgi:hypothetical protein